MKNAGEEESFKKEESILNSAVKEKYRAAAAIVNDVLKLLCEEATPGKTPLELCELGDKTVLERTEKIYNKHDKLPTKIIRGLAFPTCTSVNEVVCHYSPTEGSEPLKIGDIVKFDVGAHIDGYACVGAHTVVLQETPAPISGKLGDLVCAANMMMDVVLRCLKPGKQNNDIPPLLAHVAEAYGVTLCEGVLSHQLKRHILDGNECILTRPSLERRVEDVTFASGQVWAVDLVLSAGKGKLAEGAPRCSVFKRTPEAQYNLKLKASKEALKFINTNFPTFPFTVRALDSKSGRLGVTECVAHDLLAPYPVLCEKPGSAVVHFKRTVFVFNKVEAVTGLAPIQEFQSEKKCEERAVLELLDLPLPKKKPAPKAADPAATPTPEPEGEGPPAP